MNTNTNTNTCEICGRFGHKKDFCYKNKKPCIHCKSCKKLQIKKYGKTIITSFTMFSHTDNECFNLCHWCYENNDDPEIPYTHTTVSCKKKPFSYYKNKSEYVKEDSVFDENPIKINIGEQFDILKIQCDRLNDINLTILDKYKIYDLSDI